jgi:hypothetical protein
VEENKINVELTHDELLIIIKALIKQNIIDGAVDIELIKLKEKLQNIALGNKGE